MVRNEMWRGLEPTGDVQSDSNNKLGHRAGQQFGLLSFVH